MTQTILNKTIYYYTGDPETLQTTEVVYETLPMTTTIYGHNNMSITRTAPVFTITPAPGMEVELYVSLVRE